MALSVNALNGEIEEMVDSSFNRFDIVSDDSDHSYLNLNPPKKDCGDCFVNGNARTHKKIMQEWRILEKNLPELIFVQAYEKRVDLLRAVIIGAAGTPYHDGLFFFDIAFPADYPTRPPQVHYRSYGMRLNPNLYANGRVCLSLLNTWAGKKNEKWNPSESTVLQVLLSIQALVLNEKPYFNEPGHRMLGRSIWEKRSQAYNEDVFILSCKTMLFLLRRPPKNYEDFVARHFRERGDIILRACDAYRAGSVRVGYYGIHGSTSSSSSTIIDASEKFKTSIEKLLPELVAAFQRVGASVGNFVERLKVESKTAPSSKARVVVKKTRGGGLTKKLLRRMMEVLGLKKSGKSKADMTKKKSSSRKVGTSRTAVEETESG
ncbi:putative ubiquitin-conjugating enzyme E2 38 [Juglans microcarpa x Juglans regia]|uniref:putative ubiquitin-conjugating enzyme E2 38 n=1 Tax=Juglans microcarpa x Juglans regia TaxID=2249226 RepID=UPI001B7DB656|nr:putative ubiquitin-conjugating enzyme E2 38 [Juglans microcarpa x Juglans regia]